MMNDIIIYVKYYNSLSQLAFFLFNSSDLFFISFFPISKSFERLWKEDLFLQLSLDFSADS